MDTDLETFESQLAELAADLAAKADAWGRENEELAQLLDEAGEALFAAAGIVSEVREAEERIEEEEDGEDAMLRIPAGSIWRLNVVTGYYEWVARDEISVDTAARLLTTGWSFAGADVYPEEQETHGV